MTFGKKVPFIHCGEIVTFQFKLSKPSLHMFCIPELFKDVTKLEVLDRM